MDIMIVDDDEDDVALFCEAVEQINPALVCVVAGNGVEALRSLETYARLPACIFLDVNMPLMDGRETLRKIRENPRYAGIQIVMYSTTQDEREINSYRQAGVDFVVKPNTYSEMFDIIRRYTS
jgi:CheY-like chemotaxis protein